VALVLLIAAVIGALVASELPAQVSGGVEAAVCRVGGDDCAPEKAAPPGGGSPGGSGGERSRAGDTGDDPGKTDYWDCGWAGREACDIALGLGRGIKDQAVGTVEGLCLLHACSHSGFKDAWGDFGTGIKQVFTDPFGTAKKVTEDETETYRQAKEDDHLGVGASYMVIGILGTVFGGKKLKDIRDVGDAARKADEPGPEGEGPRDPPGRRVVGMRELDHGYHRNGAYLVEFADGSKAVYKPAGEHSGGKRRGTLSARQEVGAAQLDQLLGFDLVPTTTMWNGERGTGSLQEYVENSTAGGRLNTFSPPERDRMAALDYIIGNSDRHPGNYLTGPDGRLVAIDHGASFPDSDRGGIRSSFVMQAMNRPLSAEVLAKIRAVDPAEMGRTLRASGLSRQAVKGAVRRLEEIQEHGKITGDAWAGRFGYGDTS
jgi:hypothetical protein